MSFSTGPKEFQRNLPNAKGKDDSVLFCNDDRGREAQNPGEIPPKGWVDVARRTWKEISDANLFLVAGGVTYAILLALFPGLAALISIIRPAARSVPDRIPGRCPVRCSSG